MIKATLITLTTLGTFSSSAIDIEAAKPKSIELVAGSVMLTLNADGVTTEVAANPDYAMRLKTQNGRIIAIRF